MITFSTNMMAMEPKAPMAGTIIGIFRVVYNWANPTVCSTEGHYNYHCIGNHKKHGEQMGQCVFKISQRYAKEEQVLRLSNHGIHRLSFFRFFCQFSDFFGKKYSFLPRPIIFWSFPQTSQAEERVAPNSLPATMTIQ